MDEYVDEAGAFRRSRTCAWKLFEDSKDDNATLLALQGVLTNSQSLADRLALIRAVFLMAYFRPPSSCVSSDAKEQNSDHPLHAELIAVASSPDRSIWERAAAVLALGEIETNCVYKNTLKFWPTSTDFDPEPAVTELLSWLEKSKGEARLAIVSVLSITAVKVSSLVLPRLLTAFEQILLDDNAEPSLWLATAKTLRHVGPRVGRSVASLRERLERGATEVAEELREELRSIERYDRSPRDVIPLREKEMICA